MKSIVEKINEALRDSYFTIGAGTQEDDLLTREYNNVYGMYSNTLLRRTPFDCYVLTGSVLRDGEKFLFDSSFVDAEGRCAAEWFERHALSIYRPNMEVVVGDEYDDEDQSLLDQIAGYVKDNDYLIVK